MDCCRLCLSEQHLKSIFSDNEEFPKWSTILYKIAGIEINLNDGLPKRICSKCVEFINLSVEFWNRCQLTQEILKRNCNSRSEHNDLSFIHNVDDDNKANKNLNKKSSILNDHINLPDSPSNEEQLNSDTQSESEYIRENKIGYIGKTETIYNITQNDCKGDAQTIQATFECEICHKVLKNKNCLKRHFKRHTGFDFVCEHCGKSFATKRILLMHCRAKHGYERTDKCSYCDYTGCNTEQIKIHERLHTGEKPYSCGVCGAGFHRNSNYLQHVAVHISEKTVQCDQCPLLFKSATLMRIHRDNRHKKSKYQYRCKVCGNIFTRRRTGLIHLKRMHSVEDAGEVERINL